VEPRIAGSHLDKIFKELSPEAPIANSSIFVLPTTTAPTVSNFTTAVAVYGEIKFSKTSFYFLDHFIMYRETITPTIPTMFNLNVKPKLNCTM
jgi:hypothetical protein